MEPVLDSLSLGNLEEHEVGGDPVFRAAHWRFNAHLVVVLERATPTESIFPEGSDPGGISGVDAQTLDA